jgi:hypothetical protein
MEDIVQEPSQPLLSHQPHFNHTTTQSNMDYNTLPTQNNLPIERNNTLNNSPNINNSSPYSSVFHSQDLIPLSPINNTSTTNDEQDGNTHQNIIDLTTQSPNLNDSEIILPRNLNNSFPNPMRDTYNTTKDLGNQYPGTDT